ncbi:MAG: hypothetical protein RLZZ221_1505, partial [Verrucomicrobiota bacterium]
MTRRLLATAVALLCSLLAATAAPDVPSRPFGKLSDGREARVFSLANKSGFTAEITDLGGIIVSIRAPDRAGQTADVILGVSSAGEFEAKAAGFNAITGRYANRIATGRFTLDGKEYTLATNNGNHSLHGGKIGFDRAIWKSAEVAQPGATGVKFTHVSPDGDEGYPGELTTIVTYWLTDENELKIEYEATAKSPTVLNLTNHAYWNLGGATSGRDVLGHILHLASDEFLAVGEGMIPTGEKTRTAGTFMDFAS